MDRIAAYLLIFFTMTPWTSWGLNGWDSQPWTLIASAIYLLTRFRGVHFSEGFGIFVFFIAYGLIAAVLIRPEASTFLLLRGVTSYLTMALSAVAFYDIIKRYGPPIREVIFMNIIWLIAALIQMISPELLEIIGTQRTTDNRGLTSLAAEPTYFAIFLIFTSWFLLIVNNYKINNKIGVIIIINTISVFILAKSAMGAMFLFVSIIFATIYNLKNISHHINRKNIIIAIFSIVSLYGISKTGALEGSRLSSLYNTATSNSIADVIRRDESVNTRVEHAVIPIYASFQRWFIPGGFAGYSQSRNNIVDKPDSLFWGNIYNDKIMSWIGSMVYELGIFGVLAIFYLAYWLLKGAGVRRYFEVGLLFAFLTSAIPLAFGLVPLVFSAMKSTSTSNIASDQSRLESL